MSINVLTYNVSWEASQPMVDWCRNPYPYGPANKKNGIGFMCGASELHKDGVLISDDPMSNPCRKNIFELIKIGKYDLVGMQEYVHTWGGKSVYRDVLASLENGSPPLKLVWDKVRHTKIPPNGKDIEIGLLYNKKRFRQVGNHIIGDFKVEKKNYKTNTISTGHDDGRPFLIVYLVDNDTGEKYVFINAHFPQLGGLNANMDMVKIKQRVNNELTAAVKELLSQVEHEGEYEIILTSDTNDIKISFVNDLTINGKKMWIGKNVQNTCCTPIVKSFTMDEKGNALVPPWKKDGKPMSSWEKGEEFTRKNQRHRKGDVILYSGNKSFKHTYPVEKENEPYSDHAPVAAILTTPIEYNLGRRSPPVPRGCTGPDCAIQGGKRRRRTRKRRRKKRTKKKARKRRRKRTRRRGGEPTYHKMPTRKKTQKKHFQLYKKPKSSQDALKMKKKAAERSGVKAEMSNYKFSQQYIDLLDRQADKREETRAKIKKKKRKNSVRPNFDPDTEMPLSPKHHHKYHKSVKGGKKKRKNKTRKK